MSYSKPKSPSELYSEAVLLLNEQENSKDGLERLKEAALREYCEAENLFAIYLANRGEYGRARRFLKRAHEHGSFYGRYNYALSLAYPGEQDNGTPAEAIQVFKGLLSDDMVEVFMLCIRHNKRNTPKGWEMLAKIDYDWEACVSYGKHKIQEWDEDKQKTESLKTGIEKLRKAKELKSRDACHLLNALECMSVTKPGDPLIKAWKSIEQKQESASKEKQESASNEKQESASNEKQESASNEKQESASNERTKKELKFYKWAARDLLLRYGGDRARDPSKDKAQEKKPRPWWKHTLLYFAGRPLSDTVSAEPTEVPEPHPRSETQRTGNA